MKTYIITSKIRVDEDDIKMAREWEKINKYEYKDDLANLILDYMTQEVMTGETMEAEIDDE